MITMAYKFKQYGDGFKILGKYEGWHYGIWIDCMPKSFVFLKPINDNDYVFTCVDSIKAHYIDRFCGRIELSWIKCINGKFIEISAEEAQKLLDEKLSVYDSIPHPKIGDTILVRLSTSDEWEEMKVVDYCNSEYGYQLRVDGRYGDFSIELGQYQTEWKLKEND